MSRISKRIHEKASNSSAHSDHQRTLKTNETILPVRWTLKEKQLLLEAIQEHGLADLQKLAGEVKTRTAAEVEFFLNQRRNKLTFEYNRQKQKESEANGFDLNQTIIRWCSKIKEAVEAKHRGKDYSLALLEILEAAAKEESGLVPSEDEPNFGLIYMYLARVMSGFIPPSLPPLESWIMLHAWQSLTRALKQTEWHDEKEFLKNLHLRKFVPLEPEFKRFTKQQYWTYLRESEKNGCLRDLKEVHCDSASATQELPSANRGTTVPNQEVPSSNPGVSPLNHQGQSSHANAGASCSNQEASSSNQRTSHSELEQSDNEISQKYPLYDLTNHYYAHVLASLNPLTVPVSMLDRETKIVFGNM